MDFSMRKDITASENHLVTYGAWSMGGAAIYLESYRARFNTTWFGISTDLGYRLPFRLSPYIGWGIGYMLVRGETWSNDWYTSAESRGGTGYWRCGLDIGPFRRLILYMNCLYFDHFSYRGLYTKKIAATLLTGGIRMRVW